MTDSEAERLKRKIAKGYPGAEILLIIPILWDGWELDNRAAVVRQGGEPFLVHTDHGVLVGQDIEFLRAKHQEYVKAIDRTREAAVLLDRHYAIDA